MHALFSCPKSVQCWQRVGLWTEVSNVVSNVCSISSTIFKKFQQLQPPQHPTFNTLMWSIWKNRNNKVWNDSSDTCQSICDRAMHCYKTRGTLKRLSNEETQAMFIDTKQPGPNHLLEGTNVMLTLLSQKLRT